MAHRSRGAGWSEERLLGWLRRMALDPRRAGGARGHDACVLAPLGGRPVVCTDQTVEGVHFDPGTAPARIAAKAVARCVSDLAATAARPRAVLLALGAAAELPEPFLRALLAGCRRAARRLDAELVGGDLCARPGPLSLAVTAIGVFAGRGTPPARHRARPGERVLVTGALGGSRLGRHLRIVPRLAEGRFLAACGARAMMDVSDGLARDLARLAASAGVRIDLERVPVHRDARRAARASGRPAREHALFDGEDHELVATLPPAAAERALRLAARRGIALSAIGRVRPGRGLWLPLDGRADGALAPWDGSGGYVHGG